MKLNNKSLVVLAVLWQLFAAIDARCDEVSKDSANFQIDESTATTLSTKIDELVSKEYFDKSKVDKIWRPAFDAERSSLLEERNLLTFATHVNSILSRLHTSHTQLYTPNDEGFFFMRNLFGDFKKDEKNPHKDDADFVGIGVGGARAAANQIRYVIDASPAALAGIKRGDKIKSLNDNAYSGYGTWYQTSGKAQKIKVERDGKELELKVTPVKQDFLDGYVTGTTQSARIIKNNGVKIGYLHFWSGGVGSQDAMAAALGDKLRDTDALVLDLRDGYGGASNDDLNYFFRPSAAFPDQQSYTRKGSHFERCYYDKPMAVLINGGTRSGKEIMAFGLKRSKRATLFGDTTAGYVVGGKYNPIDSRAILYLAVVDIKLAGERLEGHGVSPDVPVPDILGTKDPVLDRAVSFLSKRKSSGGAKPH